jgi:hypothetical protein
MNSKGPFFFFCLRNASRTAGPPSKLRKRQEALPLEPQIWRVLNFLKMLLALVRTEATGPAAPSKRRGLPEIEMQNRQ